ncbi:MAG: phosphatase PAP2 family protein [Synechococcales cyanobacterium C42_A2020_086]|nr:phosphatase PAP2 family protein [Synechococcales cyanobacterium C42_A2020_086]
MLQPSSRPVPASIPAGMLQNRPASNPLERQAAPGRRLGRAARRGPMLMTPGFALTVNSDSGVLGDAMTTQATVDLTGITSPNATVTLQNPRLTTRANAAGEFLFTNVPLALGITPFTVTARRNGRSRSFSTSIQRVASDAIDSVLEWHAIALRLLHNTRPGSLAGSRALAIAQTAVMDTVNALTRGLPGGSTDSNPFYRPPPVPVPTNASAAAAAIGAAHTVLAAIFPNQRSSLDQALVQSLDTLQDNTAAEVSGFSFGRSIANALLSERSTDGANRTATFPLQRRPGRWRPTPSQFLPAVGVAWKEVTPFVLTQGSQFRPSGPPPLRSRAYAADLNQVKRLGQIDSRSRTPSQTESIRFWIGNASTTPGMWNEIAARAAATSGQTLWQNARLLGGLNLALADAAIAAWDAKYTYPTWRPITAIRLAASDRNPRTQPDRTWLAYLEAPAHPDYVAAHSTFANAAATVLSQQFGPAYAFTSTSFDLPGIQRRFPSFDRAAQEAGLSRIFGGIHTPSAHRDGLTLGRNVATAVLQQFFR